MAVSILETIKSKANAGNTAYIVVLSLLCDTYTDLPTQYGLTGYELAQGCKAHVIDTNTDYMLDSAGNWHIYGGGIWQNVYTKTETDALLDDKQDELTTAQLDAVNSGITAEKLTADEAALVELVDSGAKNIQPVDLEIIKQSTTAGSWSGNVYTESGSTYTINDDGTITVDTTGLTNQSNLFLSPYLDINNGEWVVSGCPQGGTSETYYIATNSTSWSNPKEYGNGVELNIYNNKIRLAISVKVRSGILVFRPMICTKAAWDVSHQFEPYALSNPVLTPAAIKAVDEGAKNHLDLHAIAKTESNVTFAINSDKTISVTTNGAASAQVSTKLLGTAGNYVPNVYGGLLVSGVPNPDKGTALYIAYSSNGTSQAVATTLRAGKTTIVDGTYSYIQIFLIVYSGSNIGSTPVIFKPMICTLADWNVSQKYVPYCPSMSEMYQMILALQ